MKTDKYDIVAICADPASGLTADQINDLTDRLKENKFVLETFGRNDALGLLLIGTEYANDLVDGDVDDLIEFLETIMADNEFKCSNHVYTWEGTDVYFINNVFGRIL